MTPEEWQRVRPILESALELDPASRASFLDGACSDSFLRREVESLIASHEQAGTDALDPSSPLGFREDEAQFRLPHGKRVGAYEILEEIGAGGMGEVHRAVRADDAYRKQVAIKLVRSGQDSTFVLNRFKNERQILASLEHPNIARLLDGGSTEEGVPYFVMELVEGQRIDEYCDARKLATTERLKLFLQVCSAVQYAHQHLIIHRDIKPGNISVTAEGIPKLLDFGIAKILESSENVNQPQQTISLFRLLTPEYASPEQVKGEPITTASDVYSLGVVLYQLLTGRAPYAVPTRTPHEISRAVCETEPEKPSTAVRRTRSSADDGEPRPPEAAALSAAREGTPEKLSKRLSGDLDNILLMALRKEPQRRYSSVEEFARDIHRHLEQLPVVARKDTVAYRASKFFVRHKVGVVAAGFVTLLLLFATGVSIYQARIARAERARAERRFSDVRALANSLMFEVHDSIKDLAGATPARKLLVSKALQYLDSLSREAAGDSSLQRELAAAYEKVGDVQGHPYNANLGDTAGALASYRKALTIRESLVKNNRDPQGDRDLSNDYERVGLCLQASGDYEGALENFGQAFAIFERLASTNPDPETRERLAGGYFTIAQCQATLGNFTSALENYRKSAVIRETITGDSPALHARIQMRLAGVYAYLSEILANQNDYESALEMQRKALVILSKLSASDPTNAAYREYLSENHYWTGVYLQRKGDFAQASISYRQALTGFAELSLADPKEFRARHFGALCDVSIGTLLGARGRTIRALTSIRKGLAILEELSSSEPSDDVAAAYGAMGLVYSRAAETTTPSKGARIADWKEARSAYRKSLANWLEVKRHGALTGFNASEPDRISSELAKCDGVLTKLTAPNR
jgi:serine/threonine protein kinase